MRPVNKSIESKKCLYFSSFSHLNALNYTLQENTSYKKGIEKITIENKHELSLEIFFFIYLFCC